MNYLGETVLRLRTAWQPRIGVAWDPWNDGATKVYAFAGRFSYALPTAWTAATFADATALVTYNFDPVSVVQDPNVIGHEEPVGRWQEADPSVAPVDSGVVAPYQDELTVGVERSFGPSLTVGLKGTYRRLGSAIEDRCDFDRRSPDTDFSRCAVITPGSDGRFASGDVPTCNGLIDEPQWRSCEPTGPASPPAKRVYRGIELLARYDCRRASGSRRATSIPRFEATTTAASTRDSDGTLPGTNVDFDYPAFWHNGYGILSLDRPHRLRLDVAWVTPWRLSVGLDAFVESGAPLNKLGYFNRNYGSIVFLVPRGSAGRLPTLWGTDLTLSYPIAIGPVTVTLQAYLFNVFNKQIAISRDEAWSVVPAGGLPRDDLRSEPGAEQRPLRIRDRPLRPARLPRGVARLLLNLKLPEGISCRRSIPSGASSQRDSPGRGRAVANIEHDEVVRNAFAAEHALRGAVRERIARNPATQVPLKGVTR